MKGLDRGHPIGQCPFSHLEMTPSKEKKHHMSSHGSPSGACAFLPWRFHIPWLTFSCHNGRAEEVWQRHMIFSNLKYLSSSILQTKPFMSLTPVHESASFPIPAEQTSQFPKSAAWSEFCCTFIRKVWVLKNKNFILYLFIQQTWVHS